MGRRWLPRRRRREPEDRGMSLVKVEVEVPENLKAVATAAQKFTVDVLKVFEDGWQPARDSLAVFNEVLEELVPVAPRVPAAIAEVTAHPVKSAKLGLLMACDVVETLLAKRKVA